MAQKKNSSVTRSRPEPRSRALPVTGALLKKMQAGFQANQGYRIAQNAVTRNSIEDVALNRRVVTDTDHTFSHLLDDWTVTNQKQSGRCWLFAGLNLFRVGAMKKLNIKEFEFSQNYILFWDKLERSNYFLEAIKETAARPLEDRTVAYLLDHPLDDGGQWTMFANIVRKYGLVPQAFMPESQSSSNTRQLNAILRAKLREGAMGIRNILNRGKSMATAERYKEKILDVIYRILSINLGDPPARFTWQWIDKDKKFHREEELTPQQFARKYLEAPPDEYVCLVHDPRSSNPYKRTYTVEYLGSVVGGDQVRYLNVEIGIMKELAMRSIQEGEPVWFGCDVRHMMDRKLGILDENLYDFGLLYDTTFEMDKESRLHYHQSMMSHAMLFTGVDILAGNPRRWRVENSWGEDVGKKGFFVMNDSWFDEHMFEITVRKSRLPQDLLKAWELKPIVLPPWDPMGSLAGDSLAGAAWPGRPAG